jgi:hypothetical protein
MVWSNCNHLNRLRIDGLAESYSRQRSDSGRVISVGTHPERLFALGRLTSVSEGLIELGRLLQVGH